MEAGFWKALARWYRMGPDSRVAWKRHCRDRSAAPVRCRRWRRRWPRRCRARTSATVPAEDAQDHDREDDREGEDQPVLDQPLTRRMPSTGRTSPLRRRPAPRPRRWQLRSPSSEQRRRGSPRVAARLWISRQVVAGRATIASRRAVSTASRASARRSSIMAAQGRREVRAARAPRPPGPAADFSSTVPHGMHARLDPIRPSRAGSRPRSGARSR